MYDLSDVNLNAPKFRAEFPDGKVPIRYVPRVESEGLLDTLEALVAIHDRYDVDTLLCLAEELCNFVVDGGNEAIDETAQSLAERKVLIGRLMQGGLTLRQIARVAVLPLSDVAAAVTSERCRSRHEAVLLADDALAATDESVRSIARRVGLHEMVVAGLKRLRNGDGYRTRVRAEDVAHAA